MKIAICGTHCAGKSTLVDLLSKELHLPKIKEVAGRYTESQRQNIAIQLDILHDQMIEEINMGAFISDRSVFDNCAYIYYHTNKHNMLNVYEESKKLINSYLKKHPYDLIIFVAEYFDLIDNGVRNLDKTQQSIIFEFLSKHIESEASKFNIPIVKVKGTNKERLREIHKWLTTHPPQ